MLETIETPAANIRTEFLPYALPFIGEEEIAEVVDTLRSGWITTGPKVKRFETDFTAYVNASNAVAVNSCTAGLHVALAALNIGPGDEVIVPTMTFCATANVVLHTGATPVLVDVGPDFQISPAAIQAAITERTRAVMPVHYAGQACDLDTIYQIASTHNLAVVEDAAHAVGTTYHGLKIGSDDLIADYPGLRRAVAFSFYANKNMTTGEGGMITTSDDELAQRMRMLSLHGMSKDAWKRYTSAGAWYYEVVAPGFKDNMTDISASLGIHQLRRLDGFIARRQQIAQMYDDAFAVIDTIKTPFAHGDRNHVYHLYAIRLELDQLTVDRAAFIEELKARKIGTSVHFIPVHLHPLYRERCGYTLGSLPAAEGLYEEMLSLPIYPRMTDRDVFDVIEAVKDVLANSRR